MSDTQWLIVRFDGKRERLMGGKRGGQRFGPPRPIATIGIPLNEEMKKQLVAYGWRPPADEG